MTRWGTPPTVSLLVLALAGTSARAGDREEKTVELATEAVRAAKSDADVVAWVHANTDPAKYAGLNEMLMNRGLTDPERRKTFLPAYPILVDRPTLTNWFEIFEIDDKWMYEPENRGKPGAAPVLSA